MWERERENKREERESAKERERERERERARARGTERERERQCHACDAWARLSGKRYLWTAWIVVKSRGVFGMQFVKINWKRVPLCFAST